MTDKFAPKKKEFLHEKSYKKIKIKNKLGKVFMNYITDKGLISLI